MPTAAPTGYHSLNPFLIVDGADSMIGFLSEVFGGEERERITRPDGTIGHAEVSVGDSVVMITDANDSLPSRPSAHYVYVDDVDETFAKALAHGAVARSEPADQFYGNREGGVVDPWGNIWWIATVLEEVPPDELQARYEASL